MRKDIVQNRKYACLFRSGSRLAAEWISARAYLWELELTHRFDAVYSFVAFGLKIIVM